MCIVPKVFNTKQGHFPVWERPECKSTGLLNLAIQYVHDSWVLFPRVVFSLTCNLKPPEMLAVNANQFVFWNCSGFAVRGFNNRLHLTFTWTQAAYVEETWMPVRSECCQKESSAVWLLTLNFGRTTVLCSICFLI